ncbi:MAG: DNA (cytosine-5-)-methyltransferase [Candidatus Bathyarchaeia archaeon]
MIRSIPPGGNWRNIPEEIVAKSKRLQQIKISGGRTTYYGRMLWDKPSYTINTYFNRPGNGCFIHPSQDRLISQREAARLQSFPDWYRFHGSKQSRFKQIGNAVPPLLAYAIARGLKAGNCIDLFAGAGGLALGFVMAGFKCILAVDMDKNMCETLIRNNVAETILQADLSKESVINEVVNITRSKISKQLDLILAGPPCQGFSTAGNWDPNDPRNNLYIPLLSIVRELLPKYVLIENVPGIRFMRNGEILKKIEQSLREMGYLVKTELLKAEEYGVPQKRRRVFIFGYQKGEKAFLPPEPMFTDSQEIKFDSSGLLVSLPKPPTVREAISDLPPIEVGGGAEIMEYDDSWISSDYQRWARGHISFSEFYKKRVLNNS